MVKVDCRGLACPIPVLKTKEALEKGATELLVIVDNKASRENVKRFALKEGCSVEVEERDGLFYLKITKQGASAPSTSASETKKGPDSRGKKSVTVLIASTYVGEEEELGRILMKGFLNTFINADPMPSRIVLINAAVKMACEGAEPEILQALKKLEEAGVEVICCATCLDYYKLLEKVAVGTPSNAYDVVQALVTSDLVVRL